ncbi:hypothetical protein ABEX78_21290 [Priestia megaterium]
MGKDYKKMSDYEVEREYDINPSNIYAEREYIRRGLDEENEENSDYYSGADVGGAFGFGVILILLAAIIIISVYISLYAVGVVQRHWFFVLVLFLATSYFMFRKQGYSKFFNLLFFIGSYALFTLAFPFLFSGLALRGLTFDEYMAEPTIDFIELMKFSFFYALFMVASYFFSKIVTSRIRKKSSPYSDFPRYYRRM